MIHADTKARLMARTNGYYVYTLSKFLLADGPRSQHFLHVNTLQQVLLAVQRFVRIPRHTLDCEILA